MTRKWADGVLVALAVMITGGPQVMGQSSAPAKPNNDGAVVEKSTDTGAAKLNEATKEAGIAAIDRAAQAGKYIFLFFYRDGDEPTRTARVAFEAGMSKLVDRAMFATVNITDVREQALVAKYDVSRSPMPLVLAMAPNGVVTRNFVGQFSESQFETAFIGPGMQKALKALQDRKMLFVSVQNDATQHNSEAMQGVRDFAADPQYSTTTEIVTLDPKDPAEADFLKALKVDPQTSEAVTVFMAPPSTTVATYTGATQKIVLVEAAKKAAAGCAKPGCCPPKKKPGDSQPQPQSAPAEKKP